MALVVGDASIDHVRRYVHQALRRERRPHRRLLSIPGRRRTAERPAPIRSWSSIDLTNRSRTNGGGPMSDDTAATTAPPASRGLLRTLAHRLAGDDSVAAGRGPSAPVHRRDRVAEQRTLSRPTAFAAGSSSSTSGPTRASTGCGPFRTFAPGPRSTPRHGLTVIGAHTPEFGFEHDLDNVVARSRALRDRLPDRGRQRLRRVDRLREPFWPAVYLGRHGGPHPLPPLR